MFSALPSCTKRETEGFIIEARSFSTRPKRGSASKDKICQGSNGRNGRKVFFCGAGGVGFHVFALVSRPLSSTLDKEVAAESPLALSTLDQDGQAELRPLPSASQVTI